MKIDNFADQIAVEMDKAINSEENKKLFSSSNMLQKLAFTRVADEGKIISEIEAEFDKTINKTASCSGCSCDKDKDKECKCSCHEEKESKAGTAEKPLVVHLAVESIVSKLITVSEQLDAAGFEKLAADSAVLAGRLVVEAKAKKDSKGSKPKMSMKERMEKMRKMKGGKKSPAKSSKPASKSKSDKSSKPASKSSKPASKSKK
jgi:hypothetical protein